MAKSTKRKWAPDTLTQAGYKALTESNEARYPASDRRFGVNA